MSEREGLPPEPPLPVLPRPVGGGPGRVRRWVIRPLVWGALLLILAVVALLFFAQSELAHRRAAALVVARLSETLGRQVQVGGVDYQLYPLAFELHHLVVPGARPGDPPFAVVPRVRIQASWRDLRKRVLQLEQIEVLQPRVFVVFFPDGSTNVPSLRGRKAGRQRFEVRIGRVLVQDGRLRVDQRELPLEVDARAVWGRMVGREPDVLEGLVTAQEVVVVLPDAKPYRLTTSLRGSFEPGVIRIHSGRFVGPEIAGEATGAYEWEGRRKSLGLTLRASGQAALANRLGYMEAPIAGRFATQGRLAIDGSRWRFRGAVESPRIDVLDRVFTDLTADLAVEPGMVRAERAHAHYAGGTLRGTVVVDTDARTPEGAGRPVDLDLDLAGLDLARLLEDQDLSFPALAARVNGPFRYRFLSADPLAGSGIADLRLEGEAAVPAGRRALPVSGTARLAIADGVVATSGARFTAPEQTLLASGSYSLPARRGRFELRLETGDLGRLAVLVPVEGPPPAWLPTAGRGEASGTLTIAEGAFSVATTVDLAAVAAPALAADRLTGTLTYSPEALRDLRLTATRDGGSLAVSGTVPLPDSGGGGRPLVLAVQAVAWPLAAAADLVPGAPPVTGTATGQVDLRGTVDDLAGEAALALADLTLSGHELGQAQVEVAFGGPVVTLRRAQVFAPAGELLASGRFDRATGAFELSADAPALVLDEQPLRGLLRGELSGTVALRAAGSGTLDDPRANLSLTGRGLRLGGRSLPEGSTTQLSAVWEGGRLDAEGSLAGLLTLQGGGRLDRRGADLAFAVQSHDLAAIARIASPRPLPEFTGRLAGELRVAGDFAAAAPDNLRARLTVPELALEYEGNRLASVEPVVVSWSPAALRIESLYLREPQSESDLFLTGTVGLGAAPNPLDLRLQSTVAARWAELVLPGVQMEGYLDLLASLRGTTEDPALDGVGELRQARLIVPNFPHAFEELTGTVLLYRDAVVVDGVSARVAGGTVRASGRLGIFGDPSAEAYRFQLTADDVSLRYPEGFLIRGDAELSLVGGQASRQLRGLVTLDRAYYLQDVETGTFQLLQRMLQRERLEIAETDPFLASTQLNVQVLGPEALRVRNNVADLTGELELAVRGSLAAPVVVGEVELDPGGKLVYADNEYEIERGRLTFNNPYRIDPVIDLVARTEVRNYDIVLSLAGTLDRLNAKFTSDEGLADLEVLALLATGKELEGEGRLYVPGQRRAEEEGGVGASGFLYGQAASAVSKRVSSLFGFDRFRIDPLASTETGTVGGVRLTVGKRISRDLFVTYSSNPAASEEYLLRIEWQVGENVVLVLTRDGKDETFAVDAQWERRF
ncbi:MAG TPA: translocation/assembly module TamB domain-containing protein [Thermoanaerobaculia bacterium]|nr:translocation/assembly module TamB domain-containing protein [Thermoanaerobaculia bacterium]